MRFGLWSKEYTRLKSKEKRLSIRKIFYHKGTKLLDSKFRSRKVIIFDEKVELETLRLLLIIKIKKLATLR